MSIPCLSLSKIQLESRLVMRFLSYASRQTDILVTIPLIPPDTDTQSHIQWTTDNQQLAMTFELQNGLAASYMTL